MKKVDMRRFAKQFAKEYNFLYNNNDNVAGYRDAVDFFDGFVKHHGDFVGDFAKYRGDFISSDREAAAFAFALAAVGAID